MVKIFITPDLPNSFSRDLKLVAKFCESKIIHADSVHLQRTSCNKVLDYLKNHNFELVITKSKRFCASQKTDDPKIICINGNIGRAALNRIILLNVKEIFAFVQSQDRVLFLGQNPKVVALLQSLDHVG